MKEKGKFYMGYIDLHVHSTASDGTYTPSELVRYAIKKQLIAFALTDHDTIAGIEEAKKEAKEKEILIIPGIELSAEYKKRDIHILGYRLSYQNKVFQKKLEQFQDSREKRNEEMIEKLKKNGISITMQEMKQEYGRAILTRAHVAKIMLKKGYVKCYEEAFRKYIGQGCPCYIPKKTITPKEAIELIQLAGGKAVLAHPLLYHFNLTELEELVRYLKELGLEGIEAIYSMNTEIDDCNMRKLAKKYGLFITGGSDFHGAVKPNIDLGSGRGNLKIPEELLKDII